MLGKLCLRVCLKENLILDTPGKNFVSDNASYSVVEGDKEHKLSEADESTLVLETNFKEEESSQIQVQRVSTVLEGGGGLLRSRYKGLTQNLSLYRGSEAVKFLFVDTSCHM